MNIDSYERPCIAAFADDEQNLLQLLLEKAHAKRFNIATEETGAGLIALCKSSPEISVFFCDYLFDGGELNGAQTLLQIRGIRPDAGLFLYTANANLISDSVKLELARNDILILIKQHGSYDDIINKAIAEFGGDDTLSVAEIQELEDPEEESISAVYDASAHPAIVYLEGLPNQEENRILSDAGSLTGSQLANEIRERTELGKRFMLSWIRLREEKLALLESEGEL